MDLRAAVLLVGGVASSCGGVPEPGASRPEARGARAGAAGAIRGRFTPPDGQTLLIVGQDLGAVAGYAEGVHPTPGGERWVAEIGNDSWLHGGPGLFDTLTLE
jgi:hypothetical protein